MVVSTTVNQSTIKGLPLLVLVAGVLICLGEPVNASTASPPDEPGLTAVPLPARPASAVEPRGLPDPALPQMAEGGFPESESDRAIPAHEQAAKNRELEALGDQLAHSFGLEPPPSSNLLPFKDQEIDPLEGVRALHVKLELARKQRLRGEPKQAAANLISVLRTNAPVELHQASLFELALVAQDQHQLPRALQIFAQFLRQFPEDPRVPEVILRQGLIYGEMGATELAITKFYTVMTSALNLKLDELGYYRRLVLQAQTEIADSFYLQGRLEEAASFLYQLLKLEANQLNTAEIHYKLIRSLSALGRHSETIGQASLYVAKHPREANLGEVRYLLVQSLRALGRKEEALTALSALLQEEQQHAEEDPAGWIGWQKRAGNQIGNQLYQEGDYVNSLALYQRLVALDADPAWVLPVSYQIGLVYERLEQTGKATATYQQILEHPAARDPSKLPPALVTLLEMAQWRIDHLSWLDKTMASSQAIRRTSLKSESQP